MCRPTHIKLCKGAVGHDCVRGDKDAAIVLDGHDAAARHHRICRALHACAFSARQGRVPRRHAWLGSAAAAAGERWRTRRLLGQGGVRYGTQVSKGGVGRAAAVFLNGMIKRAPGRAAEALLKAQSNYHINNSMEVRRSAGSLRMRVHAAVQHSCCSILLRVPSCFPVSFAQGSGAMGCWPRSSG